MNPFPRHLTPTGPDAHGPVKPTNTTTPEEHLQTDHPMTRHTHRRALKCGALFAAALLAGMSAPSHAGETTAVAPAPPAKAPPANPLSFAGGLLTFDVQERLRWEIRDNNFDFNDAVNVLTDDNWLLQRFRIGLMVKPIDWLAIYAQGQDSREINSDRADFPGVLGAEGDNAFDLRQGYVEFANYRKFPLGVKIGRQLLSYGDERLVGSFDWNNIGRTFDAVKLRIEQPKWWLDGFASTVVIPTRGKYNQSDFGDGNETERGQVFSGLYFSTTALPFQTTDLYAFHLHEETGPKYQPAAIGDTNFVTLGFRVKSKPGAFYHAPAPAPDGKSVADGKSAPPPPAPKPLGFDYDGEFAFQTGEVRGLDLTAAAVHAGLGYTFEAPWTPRIGVEYNFATGDNRPGDTDIGTFQNLFPTNHKFYGFMDVFSWQNMHNPAISVKVSPTRKLTAQLDYHAFWLATNEDAWYRANGTTAVRPVNAVSRNADKFAGSEIDLTVTYKPMKQLALVAGYSHFFAGSYLKDTGAHDDADFGYVQATIEF